MRCDPQARTCGSQSVASQSSGDARAMIRTCSRANEVPCSASISRCAVSPGLRDSSNPSRSARMVKRSPIGISGDGSVNEARRPSDIRTTSVDRALSIARVCSTVTRNVSMCRSAVNGSGPRSVASRIPAPKAATAKIVERVGIRFAAIAATAIPPSAKIYAIFAALRTPAINAIAATITAVYRVCGSRRLGPHLPRRSRSGSRLLKRSVLRNALKFRDTAADGMALEDSTWSELWLDAYVSTRTPSTGSKDPCEQWHVMVTSATAHRHVSMKPVFIQTAEHLRVRFCGLVSNRRRIY